MFIKISLGKYQFHFSLAFKFELVKRNRRIDEILFTRALLSGAFMCVTVENCQNCQLHVTLMVCDWQISTS